MSRATWYRKGQPTEKPSPRITQKQAAKQVDVSLRSLQRAAFVKKHDPEAFEQMRQGIGSGGAAERRIKAARGENVGMITITLSAADKEVLAAIAANEGRRLGEFILEAALRDLRERGLIE